MRNKPIKLFIGIDVSKEMLDVFCTSRDRSFTQAFKVENTPDALVKLERKFKRKGIVLNPATAVVFEHTGVYSKVLLKFLSTRKSKVFIESGLRIKKSMGIQRGKTDEVDAQRIADFGMRHYDELKCWEPPREIVVLLKRLLTDRERLKKDLNYFEVHLKEFEQFSSPQIIKQLNEVNKPAVHGLHLSLREVQKRLEQVIHNDTHLNRCF